MKLMHVKLEINGTQLVVLGFFLVVWIALIAILLLAPDVYAQTLRQAPAGLRGAEVMFLAVLSAFIAVLVFGVLRRWRWIFWLVLVAFVFGVLRVPVAILEVVGLLPASGPIWYETLQGVIGVAQLAIALAMWLGYRKSGVWGDFIQRD